MKTNYFSIASALCVALASNLSSQVIAEEFQLINDAHFQKTLEAYWKIEPVEPTMPETMHQWFTEAMSCADHCRWYHLAEAVAREDVVRWPHDAPSWVGLSCYVGKQGRFQEALDLADKAESLTGINKDWPHAIGATWLWCLGKHDEADARMSKVLRPTGTIERQRLWIICRIFYLSVKDPGSDELRALIREITTRPRNRNWVQFLERDIAFDVLREQQWFVTAVGSTASGPSPTSAFRPIATTQEEQRLIDTIPHVIIDPASIQTLNQEVAMIGAGRWQDAIDLLHNKPQSSIESKLVEALARAGMDDVTGSMDALRSLNHAWIKFDSWTYDTHEFFDMADKTAHRLYELAKTDPSMARPFALSLQIEAHFLWAFHEYDGVVTLMNTAEKWCPTLAETPNLRAIALDYLHKENEAIADYNKAIALRSSFVDPVYNLAYIQKRDGKYSEALAFMDRVKESGPMEPGDLMQRALCLVRCGRIAEGISSLDQLASEKPPLHLGLPTYLWECSSSCMEQRHFPEAEHEIRLIISHFPSETTAWIRLSGILAREGKYQEAIDAAQHNVDFGPPIDLYASISIALCEFELGQHDQAMARMKQLPDPDSDSEQHECQNERALFAAVAHDEATLQACLQYLLTHKGGYEEADPTRLTRWLTTEVYLDPYRDLHWFKQVVQQSTSR